MLNADQQEALQEIANIGMGQAGASIARVLDHFVQLSIPRILNLPPDGLVNALARTVGPGKVSAVRQTFRSTMHGEAIAIFGEQRCSDLADLMGHDPDVDQITQLELLLDVSNILVGACLSGIAGQLGADIGFSPPSLIADQVPVDTLLQVDAVSWKEALLVEVNFQLAERSFACHLVILLVEDEIRALAGALDRFLETYQ